MELCRLHLVIGRGAGSVGDSGPDRGEEKCRQVLEQTFAPTTINGTVRGVRDLDDDGMTSFGLAHEYEALACLVTDRALKVGRYCLNRSLGKWSSPQWSPSWTGRIGGPE